LRVFFLKDAFYDLVQKYGIICYTIDLLKQRLQLVLMQHNKNAWQKFRGKSKPRKSNVYLAGEMLQKCK